jgi:lysophospholipase L1-like esterase
MRKIFIVLFLFCLCACAKREITNYPPKAGPIVVFGDSITYGYGVKAEEAYPALLAKSWNREVINLGVSGDTSLNGSARKEDLKNLEPSFVLIEFGGNDFLKKVPKTQTQKALEEIVDYVHSIGAIAVLVDTGGYGPMDTYTKINKQIAKQKNTLYIDGIMKDIFSDRNLRTDQIHPNQKGHQIIAQRIDKVLNKYL